MRKKTASEEVIDYIQGEIKEGNLERGDRLPSEELLSKNLNVSRASLREALQKLETLGLIETKHGKGSFISSNPSLDAFKNFIPPLVLSNNQDIIELMEARRFVEIGTARLAADNAAEGDLRQLEDHMNEMKKGFQEDYDLETFLQHDLNFHLKIAESSGNEILYKLLQALKYAIEKELRVILEVPGLVEFSYNSHEKVLNAIKEADGERAGRKIDEHIVEATEMFKESINSAS